MKDIKDYLHFYLGCEVELDNGGSKVIKKLIAVGGVDDGEYQYCKLRLGSPEKGHVHSLFLKENRIKLLLRPLSDMTEEEWNDIESKSSVSPDAWGYNGLRDNFIKAGKDYRFHWSIVNEALIELRKRGIDVDGLIDAGLGIDKTKLPTNERH